MRKIMVFLSLVFTVVLFATPAYAMKQFTVINQINNNDIFQMVADNKLWLSNGTKLYISTDSGRTRTIFYDFGKLPFDLQMTNQGAILARIQTGGYGTLKRSTPGSSDGSPWTDVWVNMPSDYMREGICFMKDGTILIGAYKNNDGRIWISNDDGKTFQVQNTLSDVKHIHFIQEDLYNPGTIWVGTGDSNSESKILMSTDKGKTFKTVGSGSQDWRAVSLVFRQDKVLWGTDSSDNSKPPTIMEYARSTGKLNPLLRVNAPVYYSHVTAKGEILFATTPEDKITTITPRINVYYSADEGKTWGILYSCAFTMKNYYQWRFIGEMDDVLYSWHSLAGSNTRFNFAFKITDAVTVPTVNVEPYITGGSGILDLGSAYDSSMIRFYNKKDEKARVTSDGLEISPAGDGIILKSPDGTRYKLTINNGGVMAITPITK